MRETSHEHAVRKTFKGLKKELISGRRTFEPYVPTSGSGGGGGGDDGLGRTSDNATSTAHAASNAAKNNNHEII